MPYMLPTSPVLAKEPPSRPLKRSPSGSVIGNAGDEQGYFSGYSDGRRQVLGSFGSGLNLVDGAMSAEADSTAVYIQPPTPERIDGLPPSPVQVVEIPASTSSNTHFSRNNHERDTRSTSKEQASSSKSDMHLNSTTRSDLNTSPTRTNKSPTIGTMDAPIFFAEVRSPPKRRSPLLGKSDDISDITGLTGAVPAHSFTSQGASSVLSDMSITPFEHNDSIQLATKRSKRPRLFGFTEMIPDSPGTSDSGSLPNSARSSRDNSPTRSGSLEILPRKRFTGSLERSVPVGNGGGAGIQALGQKNVGFGSREEVQPAPAAKQVAPVSIANGTTPVSGPLTSIPRRTSINRASSEVSLRHIAPVKPVRQVAIGSRTSAQRNESSLKLDLKSIRANNVEKALGSAPVAGTAVSPLNTPSLLRKKSGELIKPALKAVSSFADLEGLDDYINAPRSAPVTPGAPKYVHFDAQLEKVKLFLADQKPQVVSRDGSPTEGTTSEGEEFPFPNTDDEDGNARTQLEIRLPNFSTMQPHDKDVYLESIFLDEDRKNLKGVVRVKNLAYDKWVAVRFTYDWWQTTNETSAAYKESIQGGQYDRFQFTLKLQDLMTKIEEKKLFICLRYTAGGRDIWDSNDGQNYAVTFVKVPIPVKPKIVPSRANASSGAGSIAAGMGKAVGGRTSQWDLAGNKQDRLADLRMHLDRLSAGDEEPSLASQGALKGVRSPVNRVEGLPNTRQRESGLTSPQPLMSPLSQRYDFGASLSSARGGKIRSPTPRSRDLPPSSPTGLTFASDAVVGPTFEFYSPQLSSVDLPGKAPAESPADLPTPKASGLALDNLPVPVLKVEEPSPPAADYFMPSAPAATTGPTKATHSPPRTALPRMYSEPPFARSPQRNFATISPADPSAGALGIKVDGPQDNGLDASPPSASNSSAESSLTDSPPSPSEIDLPAHARAPSFDDIANMSYKSILEQFCWGGGASINPVKAPAGGLDNRRTHSTSDLNKYRVDHLELAQPTDLSLGKATPKTKQEFTGFMPPKKKRFSPPSSKRGSPPVSFKTSLVVSP